MIDFNVFLAVHSVIKEHKRKAFLWRFFSAKKAAFHTAEAEKWTRLYQDMLSPPRLTEERKRQLRAKYGKTEKESNHEN